MTRIHFGLLNFFYFLKHIQGQTKLGRSCYLYSTWGVADLNRKIMKGLVLTAHEGKQKRKWVPQWSLAYFVRKGRMFCLESASDWICFALFKGRACFSFQV